MLVGSVVALVAYIMFATTPRRLLPTLAAVLLGLGVIVGVVAYISSVSGAGVFDRYATITPSKLASTTNQDRGESISAIPGLFVHYPLGDGLGSVGPASGFAGGGASGGNGETEPGFLLSELGIPGLVVLYGFMLYLLFLGVTRIRQIDPDTRIFVAALLAGLVAILVMGISTTTSATSPLSPYLWFAGGALSYWLTTGARPARLRPPRLAQQSAPPVQQGGPKPERSAAGQRLDKPHQHRSEAYARLDELLHHAEPARSTNPTE